MKLSDYLVQYLVDLGVKHVFLITGGACTHLVDSLGRNENIDYVCVQHEQAAAMAAEAYSRITGNLGVAMTTSGPGATNLITGIGCAWFDSIPCLFLTGQVNIHEQKGSTGVRQFGFQETEIVDIVRPITKFSEMIREPEKIKYYLDKAVHIAKSGRPGPVLLDIPLNIQHAEIEPENLVGFEPEKEPEGFKKPALQEKQIEESLRLMEGASRPVILAAAGIKLAKAEKEFEEFIDKLGFPVVVSWGGIDILDHSHPLYFGPIGINGHRAANFIVQNSDLLISLGSRLDTRQTGGQADTFARGAKKIIVDIDKSELNKGRVKANIPIHADVKDFLSVMNKRMADLKQPDISSWLAWAREKKEKYPICPAEYHEEKEYVNPYVFFDVLYRELKNDDVVIADCGANLAMALQGLKIKRGRKLFSAFGNSPMGYAFPAAIGASFALNKKPIICTIGDGGMQMNVQELQTVFHYKLPIKIFLFNNSGYGIIRQFHDSYFNSRYEAAGQEKGLTLPDFKRVAEAYGLKSELIANHSHLQEKIRAVLQSPEAVLAEVLINPQQKIIPKLEAKKVDNRYISKPIEDQYPYLSREEFLNNMIIPPLNED